jgi:hypothetical protein
MKERTITLIDVTPGRKPTDPVVLKFDDVQVGIIALRELRRNNIGMVNLGQIKKLENHITETGKKRFTKKELKNIIGEEETC